MGNKGSSSKHRDKASQSLFDSAHVPLETKSRFKKQDLKMLEALFHELEDNRNHTLDKSTFLKLFPRASGLLGERLYLQFDSSNDGVIDFNEFLSGIGIYIKGEEAKRIEFLFNMFDYTHSGQLTRDALTLMLHAIIITDDVVEEENELEDFSLFRNRLSLHVPSVPSVDSNASLIHINNNINNNNHNNHYNNNNLPLSNIPGSEPSHASSLDEQFETIHEMNENRQSNTYSNDTTSLLDPLRHNQTSPSLQRSQSKPPITTITSIPSVQQQRQQQQPQQPQPSSLDSIDSSVKLDLEHVQQQYSIDPRLLAEENRIAMLFDQLHDLSNCDEIGHINIINEITTASKISPKQERLTIEQLVAYAFKVIPTVRPDPNNSLLDYMALEHFTLFVHRNPSILGNLEEILDCVTWLDPRSDEQRLRDDDEIGNNLMYLEEVQQVLCCLHCGFTVRNCPLCGSGLTPNQNKTFSTCNNETTGLCKGWSTEGKFAFCLQCGDRLQAETLPTCLTSTINDVIVISAVPNANSQRSGGGLNQTLLTHHLSRQSSTNGDASNNNNNNNNNVVINTQTQSVVYSPQNSQSTLHNPEISKSSLTNHYQHHQPQQPQQPQQQPHAGINIPDLSYQGSTSSISQLSLYTTSDHHPHNKSQVRTIPESPSHRTHTTQHGHHVSETSHHGIINRSQRVSSNHLQYATISQTPSKNGGISSTGLPLQRIQTSHSRPHPTDPSIVNSHSAHHHATTHKQAVHYEGLVYVRSNGIIKHLKSRWLLCRGGFLYLFRAREDREPISVIFLEGVYITPLDEDTDPEAVKDKDLYGFEVKTKAHRYTFYMKQHDQRQSWVKILRQASKTQQIDHFYTFKRQVGKGKFATVYEATSRLNPDRKYAVKVISKLLMEKPEHLEQLRAEISIIKLAHHPNIIRMKEMFEDQHNIYLVMPLISGGDMFDRILLRKTFPEATTRLIMWRLFSAVDYLHDREIVHCDIKPENILLLDDQDDDNVILADFGLSSFFDPGCDGLHKQQGTISYLAPEVLRGEYYSKTIDIYALGVCAYLFLSGQLPFQGYSQNEIIEETLKGEVHFGEEWKDISLNARLFVQQLLSPNSAHRPSAEQALLDPWFDPIRQEINGMQQARYKKTLNNPFTSPQSMFSTTPAPIMFGSADSHLDHSSTPHHNSHVIAASPFVSIAGTPTPPHKQSQPPLSASSPQPSGPSTQNTLQNSPQTSKNTSPTESNQHITTSLAASLMNVETKDDADLVLITATPKI